MLHNKLVSCIIIFLNGEKFMEEAIASIFAQTHDNWELLLVDDGSTDNSTNIALNYAKNYPEKVRYLSHLNHENKGMSASRNLGIANSKGDYIAFLDADDIWLNEKLAQQIAIFHSYPAAMMVYGKVLYWYSWDKNRENQPDFFPDLGVKSDTLIQPPQLLFQLFPNIKQPPVPSNVMLHREVFNLIGGFEENFTGFAEDKVFFTKLELNLPVFIASKYWVKHRKHQNSCSYLSSKNNQEFLLSKKFYPWAEKYLIAQGMKNTLVWEALQKAKIPYNYPFLYWVNQKYLQFLSIIVKIGRKIIPIAVRHWLWINIGKQLFFGK